jgi:hypothetical protein
MSKEFLTMRDALARFWLAHVWCLVPFLGRPESLLEHIWVIKCILGAAVGSMSG